MFGIEDGMGFFEAKATFTGFSTKVSAMIDDVDETAEIRFVAV
jgi:hypothetical protein